MKLSEITESILAIMVVGGIVFVAVYQTLYNRPLNIPELLIGFGGLILGSYFRGRSTNGTIQGLTNALQNSVPVNTAAPIGGSVYVGPTQPNP